MRNTSDDDLGIGTRLLQSLFGPLTTEGALLFGIAFLVALLGSTTRGTLLFFYCLALASFLVVSRIASTWALRGFRVERSAPPRATVDRAFRVQLTIKNRNPLSPLGSLRIEEQIRGVRTARGGTIISIVAPRGQAHSEYRMVIRRRGEHTFAPSLLTSSYPLGLYRLRRMVRCETRVLVRPRLGRLTSFFFAEVERQYRRLKRTQASRTEEDFRGLREYRHGDNPRWIHWKRSARLGTLYVKEFEQPKARKITILIETHPPSGAVKGRAAIEKAISFAATVLSEGVRRGYRSALGFCGPELTVLDVKPRQSAAEECLDALARLDYAAENTLLRLAQNLPQRAVADSLVLILLSSDSDAMSGEVRAALAGAEAIWTLKVPSANLDACFSFGPRWPYLNDGTLRDPSADKLLSAAEE